MTNESNDTFYCIPKVGAARLAETKIKLKQCDQLVDSINVAYSHAITTISYQDSIIEEKQTKIDLLEQNVVDTNHQLQKEIEANLALNEIVKRESKRAIRAKKRNTIIGSIGIPVVIGLGTTVAILSIIR